MKRRRHRQSRSHQPKNLIYPEIPTLSVMGINHGIRTDAFPQLMTCRLEVRQGLS